MSNSLFVPMRRLPLDLGELQQALNRAFDAFGLAKPRVQVHEQRSPPQSFGNLIVTILGQGPHEHCWISFNEYPCDLTGVDATSHMGDVTTRGSWAFAAVAVFALFDFGGSTAFNDSGELDGRPEYDPVALRKVIDDALASGNQYLAR